MNGARTAHRSPITFSSLRGRSGSRCRRSRLLLGRSFLFDGLADRGRERLRLLAFEICEAAAAFLNLVCLLAHKFFGVRAGLLRDAPRAVKGRA